MSRWVLADTSAIVGLFMQEDEWHDQAVAVLETLKSGKRKMLTTTDVFDEVVTALRRWAGYDKAIEAGDALKASALMKVVSVDDAVRDGAWATFRKHRFPHLSLTDCSSFAMMERFGIREAFTFDEDFKKLGCQVLPENKDKKK